MRRPASASSCRRAAAARRMSAVDLPVSIHASIQGQGWRTWRMDGRAAPTIRSVGKRPRRALRAGVAMTASPTQFGNATASVMRASRKGEGPGPPVAERWPPGYRTLYRLRNIPRPRAVNTAPACTRYASMRTRLMAPVWRASGRGGGPRPGFPEGSRPPTRTTAPRPTAVLQARRAQQQALAARGLARENLCGRHRPAAARTGGGRGRDEFGVRCASGKVGALAGVPAPGVFTGG